MSPFAPFPSAKVEPREESISYVTAIAALTGVTQPLIAVAAQHLLGAVAGQNAWVEGAAGEPIRPAFSLIVAGGDDPRWQRALELLAAPLLACQNRSREISRGCRSDVLREALIAQHKRGETCDLVKDAAISSPFSDAIKISVNRCFDVLSKPLTLLEAPDLPTYAAGMREAMDREALIFFRDGRLFEQAMVRRPAEQANQLIQALARALDGCSEHVPEKNRAVDLCDMERTQVTLHVSASANTVREALLSERPAINSLTSGAMILPVTFTDEPPQTFSRSQLVSGYGQWRKTVSDVFTARRNGGGMRFQLDDNHHAALMELTQDLLARLPEVPEPVRSCFRSMTALPYRLMWGVMAAARWGGAPDAESAVYLTNWAFEQQQSLLRDIDQKISTEQRADFKARIWEKLKVKGPCTRRTLVRCFTTQRIEIFEPALKELADEQRVRCLDGGLIEALGDVRSLQGATPKS